MLLIYLLILIIAIPILFLNIILLIQLVVRFIEKVFHHHHIAPPFIGPLLDSDTRRKLQPPKKIIERSGIKKGMKVLELGCGSGAYTTFLAKAVGEEGTVYALDTQEDMLNQLRKKLSLSENKDIKNVKIIQANAYNLPFKDDSFDLVCVISVLSEIYDRERALKEVRRVLKPKGILAVTELFLDVDYPFKSTTIKFGKKAGFKLDKVLGSFWHYTVRFIKP